MKENKESKIKKVIKDKIIDEAVTKIATIVVVVVMLLINFLEARGILDLSDLGGLMTVFMIVALVVFTIIYALLIKNGVYTMGDIIKDALKNILIVGLLTELSYLYMVYFRGTGIFVYLEEALEYIDGVYKSIKDFFPGLFS